MSSPSIRIGVLHFSHETGHVSQKTIPRSKISSIRARPPREDALLGFDPKSYMGGFCEDGAGIRRGSKLVGIESPLWPKNLPSDPGGLPRTPTKPSSAGMIAEIKSQRAVPWHLSLPGTGPWRYAACSAPRPNLAPTGTGSGRPPTVFIAATFDLHGK